MWGDGDGAGAAEAGVAGDVAGGRGGESGNEEDAEDSGERCTICLHSVSEGGRVVVLHCGHRYHRRSVE